METDIHSQTNCAFCPICVIVGYYTGLQDNTNSSFCLTHVILLTGSGSVIT